METNQNKTIDGKQSSNPGHRSNTWDCIILGAGHNVLVLQAYLSRAGLRTVTVERRNIAGGGLSTMEDPRYPGFMHNTHSFFHRAIKQSVWYKELELERHGAEYIEPELNTALVLRDGRVLEWWTDFERTVESFSDFSRRDATALRRWRDDFLPIVEEILVPEAQAPPLPPDERRRLLEQSAEGRLLLEVQKLSPLEFVEREFENPVIKAGLLFFNGLREVDLRCKGFGHHIASLLASSGKAQMCLGGSAALGRALVSAVQEAGGDILLGTEPEQILVENGRATGVQTTGGRILRATKLVASGLNPQQTFLDLINGDLPAEWRRKAEGFRYNLIAPLFGVNLVLREPPIYSATDKHPELERAFMVILGLEHFDQYTDIVSHHQVGTIPPTVMWGCCPTQHDKSQAPEGGHVAFMWEKLPYHLYGDASRWDDERDSHAEAMLKLWKTYAPNIDSALVDWFCRSPLDTERTFLNMKEGDLLVGAFTNGQIGYNRPFPGAGHYRGHVEGLYLCGSCCHPGGNITGLPGYNAAQVITNDYGLPGSWPIPITERLWTIAER